MITRPQEHATARAPAALREPLTISEWWRNRSGASIRIRLSTFEGHNLIDIRTWHSADGKLVPGKGLAVGVKHLPRLAAALAKAVAKATELGLIAHNDNDDGGVQ
jgi:hypothetical protein